MQNWFCLSISIENVSIFWELSITMQFVKIIDSSQNLLVIPKKRCFVSGTQSEPGGKWTYCLAIVTTTIESFQWNWLFGFPVKLLQELYQALLLVSQKNTKYLHHWDKLWCIVAMYILLHFSAKSLSPFCGNSRRRFSNNRKL